MNFIFHSLIYFVVGTTIHFRRSGTNFLSSIQHADPNISTANKRAHIHEQKYSHKNERKKCQITEICSVY